MAELPKVVESVIDGCNDFAANSNKAESKSALRQLFYLLYAYAGIKINPKEYTLPVAKFVLLGFLFFGLSSDIIYANSSVSSPNKPAYDYQWIPVNGIASQDAAKVEVQIYQHESNTYWDGQCWVGEINWLLCKGTTLWDYPITTYFSDNLKYTVKSRSTDASGNTETPSDGITFVIDKKPPTSYISFPQNGKTYSNIEKIYGQAQDVGSGVAFVRVRLKDLTDGTYWNGKDWATNEIWVKADGVGAFSVDTPLWKVGHQYNVTSQAVDFGTLEQGIYSGYNFGVTSALTLSAKTLKQKYGYGEPVALEISFENTAKSTQVVEFPSSKVYDFTIDSVYKYSDGKTFTPSATFISFQPGKTAYTETVNKIFTAATHLLTVEVAPTAAEKLTSKSGFEVVSDTTAPVITFQSAAVDQFKYFSVPLSVKVTDNSGISAVNLYSGNQFWQMTKITSDLWTGTIPAECNISSSLSYYAEAVDLSGNKTATDVVTINIKDVPAPGSDEITITPSAQDSSYIIGITNFASWNDVYYRVYYDKGTGTIDYSSWLGTITGNEKTVTTPELEAATDYKFVIVPVTKELEESIAESAVDIKTIPAPVILIKTPEETSAPEEEKDDSPDTDKKNDDTATTIIIPVEITLSMPNITISQPAIETIQEILSVKPENSLCVSKPKTLVSEKYASGTLMSQKSSITIDYNDKNNDGYLDGTTIRETTLVILRYDDIKKTWAGGFETTVYTENNYCEAYVDRTGTYAIFSALRIYPAGVKNLSGAGTEKFEAKIEWAPSPSASVEQYNIYYQNEFYREKNYSAKYYIYWDRGTGTIDYSKAIADVKNPGTSWTSPVLETGLYKFTVRVVDIEGTEEKNTNYITVNIGKKGEASANIRVPKAGQRLSGDAVTIIADASPNTTGVLFQYKGMRDEGRGTEVWTTISTIDNKPPYAVYWDISKLANGEYKLRAVAYDLLKIANEKPSEITVYADNVNWDISEAGNPELDRDIPHNKQEKITGTGDAEIFTADGTGAIVPEGVAEQGTILNITAIETLPVPNSSIQSIDVFREYEFSNGTTQFEEDVTIYLPYPDENSDGVVDGTDIAAETLEIYYLDEEKNEWKKADNRSGLGDGTNPGQGDGRDNSENDGTDNPNNSKKTVLLSSTLTKTISAKVKHFTKFGIFAKTPRANLDNVSVYPNPFKPSVHTYITFDGLTGSVKIKIYTIAGRLVDEFETATDGSYNWTPDLASGVYIYYIEDENGNGTSKGKIGIIR